MKHYGNALKMLATKMCFLHQSSKPMLFLFARDTESSKGEFQRQVFLLKKETTQNENRFLTGRQITWMTYDHLSDMLHVELKNDNVQSFNPTLRPFGTHASLSGNVRVSR